MAATASTLKAPMASRWRRRALCVIVADAPAPACLRGISGRGAFLETNARPEAGAEVSLHHPLAGVISAKVAYCAADGIEIKFEADAHSVAYAIAAIAGDMTAA